MQRSWKNESRHATFDAADTKRKLLIEKNGEDFQVKVKLLRSENCFIVKTWSPPVIVPKKRKRQA